MTLLSVQYLQPHMEECFQKSCGMIQSEVETHGNEIWGEIKTAVNKVLQLSAEAQDKRQKGPLQYLVFSFLKSGVYLDKMIFHLGCLDDQFYIWSLLPGSCLRADNGAGGEVGKPGAPENTV